MKVTSLQFRPPSVLSSTLVISPSLVQAAPYARKVEFAGTIESLGLDVGCNFNVGDEVFGLAYGGAYAEYIAVSTHTLMHKPKELNWEEAAGIPEVIFLLLSVLYHVWTLLTLNFRRG